MCVFVCFLPSFHKSLECFTKDLSRRYLYDAMFNNYQFNENQIYIEFFVLLLQAKTNEYCQLQMKIEQCQRILNAFKSL